MKDYLKNYTCIGLYQAGLGDFLDDKKIKWHHFFVDGDFLIFIMTKDPRFIWELGKEFAIYQLKIQSYT